eukprot:485801-Amphidinium_carterae.2
MAMPQMQLLICGFLRPTVSVQGILAVMHRHALVDLVLLVGCSLTIPKPAMAHEAKHEGSI